MAGAGNRAGIVVCIRSGANDRRVSHPSFNFISHTAVSPGSKVTMGSRGNGTNGFRDFSQNQAYGSFPDYGLSEIPPNVVWYK